MKNISVKLSYYIETGRGYILLDRYRLSQWPYNEITAPISYRAGWKIIGNRRVSAPEPENLKDQITVGYCLYQPKIKTYIFPHLRGLR